jgi:hypothetical protein
MTSSTPLPPPPGSPPGRDQQLSAAKAEAATRRASLLLYILGGLTTVLAVLSFASLKMDAQPLIDQMMASMPPPLREQLTHENLQLMVRVQAVVVGVISGFMGLSMILSAAPIGRGRRGAVVYAIVIVAICILWCGLNVLVGLLAILLGGLQAIPGVLLAGCVLAAFIACLLSLFGSYRAASFAIHRQRIALQSLRYPPGYASGYGAQVRTSGSTMTIEPTGDSTPQAM